MKKTNSQIPEPGFYSTETWFDKFCRFDWGISPKGDLLAITKRCPAPNDPSKPTLVGRLQGLNLEWRKNIIIPLHSHIPPLQSQPVTSQKDHLTENNHCENPSPNYKQKKKKKKN